MSLLNFPWLHSSAAGCPSTAVMYIGHRGFVASMSGSIQVFEAGCAALLALLVFCSSFFGCAAVGLASSAKAFVDTGHGGCASRAAGSVRGFEAGCPTLRRAALPALETLVGARLSMPFSPSTSRCLGTRKYVLATQAEWHQHYVMSIGEWLFVVAFTKTRLFLKGYRIHY